jgi:hypothetical protein
LLLTALRTNIVTFFFETFIVTDIVAVIAFGEAFCAYQIALMVLCKAVITAYHLATAIAHLTAVLAHLVAAVTVGQAVFVVVTAAVRIAAIKILGLASSLLQHAVLGGYAECHFYSPFLLICLSTKFRTYSAGVTILLSRLDFLSAKVVSFSKAVSVNCIGFRFIITAFRVYKYTLTFGKVNKETLKIFKKCLLQLFSFILQQDSAKYP